MAKCFIQFVCSGLALICAWNSAFAVEEDNIQFLDSGVVDPNATTYLYAPKVLFDSVDGKFKFWGCGGVAGDFIIYKEAVVFEDLETAPWQAALQPTYVPGTFDATQVCDPTVVEHNGVFYLQYTGVDEYEVPQASRIGVAVSYDRGRTFQRLFGGQPIIEPTFHSLYGAGQSSVARGPDGLFYMLYTDFDWGTGYQQVEILRSPVPSFPIALQESISSIYAPDIAAISLELNYNRGRGRFEVLANYAVNPNPNLDYVQARIHHLDEAMQLASYTDYSSQEGFSFGEGIGMISNLHGEIMPFSENGKMELNFIASTFGPDRGYVPWITGPVMFARFTEGINGVLTDFSKPLDKSLAGDLDGDGIIDKVIVDPVSFDWKWKLSSEDFLIVHTVQWGVGGDIPIIVKDWNNDGKDERAVFRPSEGKWYIQYDAAPWPSTSYTVVDWGLPGDSVFSGDTNADGQGELILWRPTTGEWLVLFSGSWPNVVSSVTQFGLSADAPFLHDVNEDGSADFIVWRVSNSQEYIYYN